MNTKCDITIVLDRSGSMCSCVEGTIKGFNDFVEEQKALPGTCAFTLVQFDHEYDEVVTAMGADVMWSMDTTSYIPRGTTALYDAIGRAIKSTGARLGAIPEEDRPSKVVFVIITDGLENASQEFTQKQVLGMISEQKSKHKWQFVFLGANQDAFKEGGRIGTQVAMNYEATNLGMGSVMCCASSNVAQYRTSGGVDMKWDPNIHKEKNSV